MTFNRSFFSLRAFRGYFLHGVVRFVPFIARPAVRWGTFVLFLVLLGWLAYSMIWQQLHEEVVLPPTIPPENPRLNEDVLRSLDTRRAERVEGERAVFSSFANRFIGGEPSPVPVSPSPSL